MTKSDRIRALLREGKSRSEVARILETSYQFVYQIDKRLGNYRRVAYKVPTGKPFRLGSRVVLKRQICKVPRYHGFVTYSDPRYTRVQFGNHSWQRANKGALLCTIDLEPAKGYEYGETD